MEAGIRQLGLGLDTGDLGDLEKRERSSSHIPQESGLSHPGLSADDQRGTLTGSHPLAEAVHLSKLVAPAVELHGVAEHPAIIMAVPVLVCRRLRGAYWSAPTSAVPGFAEGGRCAMVLR
jgi:hypothetical protein